MDNTQLSIIILGAAVIVLGTTSIVQHFTISNIVLVDTQQNTNIGLLMEILWQIHPEIKPEFDVTMSVKPITNEDVLVLNTQNPEHFIDLEPGLHKDNFEGLNSGEVAMLLGCEYGAYADENDLVQCHTKETIGEIIRMGS